MVDVMQLKEYLLIMMLGSPNQWTLVVALAQIPASFVVS